MSKRKNADIRALTLIHVRYLLPVILCALLVILAFVPCLRYSTAAGTEDTVSLSVLMENSWRTVRENLFGGGEITVQEERFSWILLFLVPTLTLLFAIGALSTVAVAAGALLYVNSPSFRGTYTRIWFITLLPNRVVVLILQALTLPVLFYSRMLIPIYRKVLMIDVLLNVTFPEPWVFGLLFLALSIGLCIWSAKYERKIGADPFKKIIPPSVRVIDREDGEEESTEPTFRTEAEREYYERQKRAREEQAERIRRLLNKDEEES